MEDEPPGSPRKKLKFEHPEPAPSSIDAAMQPNSAMTAASQELQGSHSPDQQHEKEIRCGITEFVSPDSLGFSGVLKKRYTDFLVNEILPTGEVVHLTSLKPSTGERTLPQKNVTADNPMEPGAQKPMIHDVAKAQNNENKILPAQLEDRAYTVTSDKQDIKKHDAKYLRTAEHESHDGLSAKQGDGDLNKENTRPPAVVLPPVEKAEIAQQKSVLPSPDCSDPLARHFRDLLPHERAALAGPSPEKPARQKPDESPTRVRQQYHIRRTSQGWNESEKKDVQGDIKHVKAEQPEESSNQDGKESQGNDDLKDTKAVDNDTGLSQWQAYAGAGKASSSISQDDRLLLESYFPSLTVDALTALYDKVINSPHRLSRDYGVVQSAPIKREVRSQIHQDIRRIFQSRFDSHTDHDGAMIISVMSTKAPSSSRQGTHRGDAMNSRNDYHGKSRQPKGKPNWQELGGEYLHFTLYKENKDTMECVSWLMKQMRLSPKNFDFAGTKDRRAVTSQRVSVYRTMAPRLMDAGRSLRSSKIGDFKHEATPMQLGDLNGNEFTITLRDCEFPKASGCSQKTYAQSILKTAISNLAELGFMNYYGLQRFGSFTIGTEEIGIKMLQENFEGAAAAILHYTPEILAAAQKAEPDGDRMSTEDKARAKAIHLFETTGNSNEALSMMPRRFSAEFSLIRFLGSRNQSRDFQGALQTLQRNLRLMYVHAYQSLVWNVMASIRWARYGGKVSEGDLVLVNEHPYAQDLSTAAEETDQAGEAIVEPSADDRAVTSDQMFVRARHLSKAEADSGDFTIFDVVLPTPGYDILYPKNDIAQCYKDFMSSERGGGLDPYDMRRSWKDISLSGSYRKLLAKPGKDISFEVRTYKDGDEQFVQTDLDRLNSSRKPLSLKNAAGNEDNDQALDEKVQPQDHRAKEGDEHHLEVEKASIGLGETQNDKPASMEDDEADRDSEGGVRIDGGDSESDMKFAVILKLQLGSSQYATMALRELMKQGGVKTYKPDFGGGR